MKIIAIVAGLIAFLAVLVLACPEGQSEWQDGCVVDIAPEIAAPVQPSDEKPPEGRMPSWQRDGVFIVDVKNWDTEDRKADQDKLDADKDGKKAAGIR